jgi:hypothetical protein
LPVIKHRQLTREVEAFGATAFESSMDLKINVEFLRINLLLGIFYSALILGDSVFKSKAELKSRSEIQFSVSTNHRVGADVEAYKKNVLEAGLRSSPRGSKFQSSLLLFSQIDLLDTWINSHERHRTSPSRLC